MKLTYGMQQEIKETEVNVPFCVMEWDERETEWLPVFCSDNLQGAVDEVKNQLEQDSRFNWDIRPNVKLSLKVLMNLGD
jgi:hypothetical protein